MNCPYCNHSFPLTWQRYLLAPLGKHVCPSCHKNSQLSRTLQYLIISIAVSCLGGIALALPFYWWLGLYWGVFGWILGIALIGIPIDKLIDEKFRLLEKNEAGHSGSNRSIIIIIVVSFSVIAIFALLVLRTFFIGYYRIPQNGMYPTLPAGSTLFTSKQTYSDASSITRGDIIVFVREVDGQRYNFIWRVIGLPGEKVESKGESLVINGKPVHRQLLREEAGKIICREQIGAISYDIAFERPPEFPIPDTSITIPADHFFVMGDNRNSAQDSRSLGPISYSSIIGKKF